MCKENSYAKTEKLGAQICKRTRRGLKVMPWRGHHDEIKKLSDTEVAGRHRVGRPRISWRKCETEKPHQSTPMAQPPKGKLMT